VVVDEQNSRRDLNLLVDVSDCVGQLSIPRAGPRLGF